MINTQLDKEFCMICGNENPPDREICECGGRNFIFGNNFTYVNKQFVCDCGCNTLKYKIHMNMTSYHSHSCNCSNCNNLIGIQIHVDDEYNDL